MAKVIVPVGVNRFDPADIADFDAWLQVGVARGWCSEPVCGMHDGTPMNDVEVEELEDGMDPCLFIVRLWE